MSGKTTAAETVTYDLEIRINAPRARVWDALTKETDGWWLPDFHVVGESSVIRFDARAGGHLIEEHENGTTLLWYTVQMCTPGESIHLVGHIAPAWGGPSTTILHLALVEKDGGTLFRIEDSIFGHVSDSHAASQKSGWAQLFTDGLKAYVEGAQ